MACRILARGRGGTASRGGSRTRPAIHGLLRDSAFLASADALAGHDLPAAGPSALRADRATRSWVLASLGRRPYQWTMSPASDPRILDARARHLLRTLIAEHVQEGEPIG